jgi:hypothetical protein
MTAKEKLDYFYYSTTYKNYLENKLDNVNFKFDATCSGICSGILQVPTY